MEELPVVYRTGRRVTGDSSLDVGFAEIFNLSIVSFKVLQRADACVVGYSGDGIASLSQHRIWRQHQFQ
jgi:hypothetical protein